MAALRLCLLIFLTGICHVFAGSGTYFVSAPKELTRGSVYSVSVDILNGTGVEVTALLRESRYNSTTFRNDLIDLKEASAVFNQGLNGQLKLQIEDNFKCHRCKLVIQGKRGLVFERTLDVYMKSNLVSVFIQTDKAIYKPGQRVRYRAFAVYPSLKVYQGEFSIIVKDPSGHKITVNKGLKSASGVVEGFLNLSDQPPFGDWSITVTAEDALDAETQTFTVAQYELPRFEVEVEIPSFALTTEAKLSGSVHAKYTFGKPVKGMVELHVGPDLDADGCGKMPKSVSIAFEIDGEQTFSIPKSSIERVMYLGEGSRVRVTAFVKESTTGVKLSGNKAFTYYFNAFTISMMSNTPTAFKPGLPYTAFIQVQSRDGMPPPVDEKNQITVYAHASYSVTVPEQNKYDVQTFTGSYALPKLNLDIPINGIIPVNLDIPSNATSIVMKAYFKSMTVRKEVSKAFSPSNNYMQLSLKDSDIKSGSVASFRIKATEALDIVYYEIISRDTITKTGTLNGGGQNTLDFEIDVTSDMGPVANLLTYYVRKDAELVADSITFNVDGVYKNKVKIDFSTSQAEPNTNIQLKVSADPMSQVFILAVDESVLLLKSGNDISTSKIENGISNQKPLDSEFALSHSAARIGEVFTKSGLIYATDAKIQMPRNRNNRRRKYGGRSRMGYSYDIESYDDSMSFSTPPGSLAKASPGSSPAPTNLKSVKRIRNKFPEAWLWTDVSTRSDGTTFINTTVPDTITTWVASAFATNQITGLGVAPMKTNMTVFRSFFVSLNYPSSLKTNEEAVIQATVFNYLKTNVAVVVTMKKSSGFNLIGVDGEVVENNVKRIQVRMNSQGVVHFPILAKEIGVFDLEVTAQSEMAADGVRRHISIEPEGAPDAYNIPLFIEGNSLLYQQRYLFDFPDSTVPGSEKINVGVSGDLIGPSLDNIDNLLSIPTGCGEQNMVKFAPNLYITRYLETTGQLSKRRREEAYDRLSAGYQRQLTYLRSDKSFSAFGNSDQSGSTWLTAYVSRTFSEARMFIYIDPMVIRDALDWLVDRQRRDGAFVELGRVIDPNTQGKGTGPALTAFCLMSLQENMNLISVEKCQKLNSDCHRTNKWMYAIGNATKYLEKNLDGIENPFTLSVVTNALLKAKSPRATRAFRMLKRMSKTEGGLTYWNGTSESSSSPAPLYRIWQPPYVRSKPINILITSYALMSYTARGQIRQALPIVKWLTKQRNSFGGFSSTQDTTVALQALSDYAARSIPLGTNLKMSFEMDNGEKLDFTLQQDNLLNFQKQEFQLNSVSNDEKQNYNIDVSVIGQGLVLGEISYNFHTSSVPVSKSFDVSTVLLDDNLDTFNLMVCTKWLKSEKSGMVVQEIEIPSGFEPDLSTIGNIAGMKRSERKGNLAVVYFDEIVKTSTCYNMLVTRKSKVAKSAKCYVHTFNYYNPDEKGVVFYHPSKLQFSSLPDVCPNCNLW